MMARDLEPPQCQLPHQVPDVQRICRGIESAIKRRRPGGEPLREFGEVGAIREQPAPLQVSDDVHVRAKLSRVAERGARKVKGVSRSHKDEIDFTVALFGRHDLHFGSITPNLHPWGTRRCMWWCWARDLADSLSASIF